MEDKRLRDKFYNTSNQELRFTKEDRNEVFEKIHKMENNKTQKKSLVSFKEFVPITVSLLVVGLCMFLFLPSILPGNVHEQSTDSGLNNELNTGNTNEPVVEEAEISTSLITVKSKEMDNRIYLNLLLTYSKDKKMMKVLSIPSETCARIADDNDGTTLYYKLLFAYSYGGAENVRSIISNLVGVPIDSHAVIDLESISMLMDSMNGIDYDLQEDIHVRAITKKAVDFEKGANHLNGEEMVALMMAATEGRILDEENLLNLINAVMDKIENERPKAQLKQFTTEIEGNLPTELLVDHKIELPSIQWVSLVDGMSNTMMQGDYYITFEKDFLRTVSEELTTFK